MFYAQVRTKARLLAFCALIAQLALFCASAARALADDSRDWELASQDQTVPDGPWGAATDGVRFDPRYLDRHKIPGYAHDFILPVEPPKASHQDRWERDFAVLLEIYRFFYQYALEFQHERDRVYATIGDFRATYVREITKKFPNLQWHVEAFRTTTDYDGIIVRNTGGGAGLRLDLEPLPGGKLSVAMLPLWGEQRRFSPQAVPLPGGTDYVLRSSVAVAYRQKLSIFEPGVQIVYQPQVIDFGQFRIYAELFVRLKISTDSTKVGQFLHVQTVSLLPKLVFWHSTDEGGVYGAPIRELLGPAYFNLGSNLYGLLNLEFNFSL